MSNQTSGFRPPRRIVWQSGVQPPGTTGVPNQSSSFKRFGGIPIVREIDGDPSIEEVQILEVSNGTLTNPGPGIARIETGASGREFREFLITGPGPGQKGPLAGDSINIQTGVFAVGGAQSLLNGSGLPILPATAAAFASSERVTVERNGVVLSKGVDAPSGREVYWVSTTEIAFNFNLRIGEAVLFRTPEDY